ncbi:MAG: winged helix-turn-helix domain-containing protein [Candidatus Caldarchaeum sp.]|nr:winged helix-turn-helix domain-containing protein [Candidatus Caldarchaeum sp.]MDW7978783.1 winged helix-turn-helix domain-containing protein [Candidatus Caldarchaeum sp.]
MHTREAIMSLLASKPMAVSEMARQLRVPRQLVHYHVKQLLSDGLVVVKDVVKSRVYSLKHGSLVAVSSPAEVQKNLIQLEEYYAKNVRQLSKLQHDMLRLRLGFALFMYQMMRTCSILVGLDSHSLFRNYGERVAEDVVVKSVVSQHGRSSGVEMFERGLQALDKLADTNPSTFKNKGLIHLRTFLGSGLYDPRVDEFLHSLLLRTALAFLGERCAVEKFPQHRTQAYSYLVRRTGVKEL